MALDFSSEGEEVSPPSSMDFSSEGTPVESTSLPKQALGTVASLLDFPLSAPAFMMGIGAEAGSRAVGGIARQLGSGESRKQVAEEGAKAKAAVMQKYGNPMQKIMASMDEVSAYENAAPAQLMSWFASKIEKAGKKVEEVTKGGVLKEDVQALVDIGMLPAGELAGKGIKAAVGKGKELLPTKEKPIVSEKPDFRASEEEFLKKMETPVEKPTEAPVEEVKPLTREEHKQSIEDLKKGLDDTQTRLAEEVSKDQQSPIVEELYQKQKDLQKQLDLTIEKLPAPEVKDKVKPTWEETHEIMWGARTVGQAIDRLIEGGYGGARAQPLLKALKDNVIARGAALNTTPDLIPHEKGQARGLYEPDQHTITLGKDGDLRVFLHESVHAVTSNVLHDAKHPATIEIQRIFDEYITNKGVDPEAKGMYGATDIHEFVSEAFTNGDFATYLDKFKVVSPATGKISTLWQQFKDAVKTAIGTVDVKARSVLDEVLDIMTPVIDRGLPEGEKQGGRKPLPQVVEEAKNKVDPRSISSQEAFDAHAREIYETRGKEEALQFFRDWNLSKKEQSIPTPKTQEELFDALHKVDTFTTKDASELRIKYDEVEKSGVTLEDQERWFRAGDKDPSVTLSVEDAARMKEVLSKGQEELAALRKKAEELGMPVGTEFDVGQNRYRQYGGKEHTWKEFWENKTGMGEKMAEEASAIKERNVFQTEDGRVIQLARHTNKTVVYEWKKGEKRRIQEIKGSDLITKGSEVAGSKLVDGAVHAIEKASGGQITYFKNALASQSMKLLELRKMVRDAELIQNLTKSDLFKEIGRSPETSVHEIPKGWKTPANIDKIPQLRGWFFDPRTAAIIEDFAKVWDNTLWTKLSGQIVKNMMLNPLPHIFNEVMHLWNARGLTGWLPGTGLGRFSGTAKDAWKSVTTQDAFYREVMREGGSILGADPRNNNYFNTMLRDAGEKAYNTVAVKKGLEKLGITPLKWYNALSKASTKVMWVTRDVMYIQYVKELQNIHKKRFGTDLPTSEAIREAERHMPNYRMPPTVLKSRELSKVLQNPNVSMFARYHIGMVRSMVETVKDLNPKNLSSPEGRAHFKNGVDTLLAIGVAMGVLYPLMDMMAEEVFGAGAKQRRAGPYHLMKAVGEVATGERDASALVYPVFTFNPMLLTLGQLAFNKNLFTGKPIYHPEDPIEDIGGDVTKYAATQIPQASTGVRGMGDEDVGSQYLAKQMDIQMKTGKQQEREARAKKYSERQAKGRKTKRERGEY